MYYIILIMFIIISKRMISFTSKIMLREVFALSKLTIFSWVVRLSSHMGAEKHPTVGSSGEYWSMNESLNQHYA